MEIVRQSKYNSEIYFMWIQMSRIFEATGEADSALFYSRKALSKIASVQTPNTLSYLSPIIGNAYAMNNLYDSALLHYRRGIGLSKQLDTETDLVDNYNGMAKVLATVGAIDSALYYLQQVVTRKIAKSYPTGLLKSALLLADLYASRHESDSTLKYLRLGMALKDTLYNRKKTIATQTLIYKDQENLREMAALKIKWRNQVIAYVSIALFILFVFTAIILQRNHRRKQLQKIRNSIADDLHDEMGSTLSSISIMSELAKGKSPECLPILNSISESASAIQENMSDIVWAVKADNDSIDNVLVRMKQFGSEMLAAKMIALEFNNEPVDSAVQLSMLQRKNFFLFYKEVINNVVKHSRATLVSVNVVHGRWIEMLINDNGIGFDTRQGHAGNGMHSLTRRAGELRGDFSIRSEIGVGTSISIRFKA